MKILVIDVGGTHVKVTATGHRTRVKFISGPKMTARQMVAGVCAATAGWKYDAVSIGYPGPVLRNQPVREPFNLGGGWVGFDFKKAFGHPVKIMNDAAMQALGSYEGGQMLFLGFGTGLGSALVSHHGSVIPLELAHLPYKNGLTYEDYVGEAGLLRLGKKKWRKHVALVVGGAGDRIFPNGNGARCARIIRPAATRGNIFRTTMRAAARIAGARTASPVSATTCSISASRSRCGTARTRF
jgi:polyphosphate glucokinase